MISLSIALWTSKFRNQFTISSKYFDMACYLKREAFSGLISFEVQRNDIWTDNIQSFETTALGTRTGYWKPTQRGTDEPPPPNVHWEKRKKANLKKKLIWKKKKKKSDQMISNGHFWPEIHFLSWLWPFKLEFTQPCLRLS